MTSTGLPPDRAPTYRVPTHVRTRAVGDESLVLDLRTERHFGLDGVGHHLWSLLRGGATIEDAVDHLAAVYDVDRAQLTADVGDLVEVLLDRGLLVTGQPGRAHEGLGSVRALPRRTSSDEHGDRP